jgi:hypothetical protein
MAVDPSTDGGVSGLLGPGFDPAALYTGDLSSPATKAQFAQRGLLAMAGSFADSAMPTRVPTPFGAVLGHAAAALGTSEDAVMDARLKAAQAGLYGAQGQAATALATARKAFTGAIGGLGGLLTPDNAGGTTTPADAAASAPVDPSVATIDATTPKTSAAAPGTTPAAAGPQALKIDPLPTNTPTIPFDKSKAGPGYGTTYLSQVLPAAAQAALPAGYTMQITSGQGARPDTPNSMHPSGGAVDIKILDPDGKVIPRDLGVLDSTGLYGRLALTARQMMDPEIAPWFAWGGNFGTRDNMHYDLGGDRGQRGTLATMADAAKHVVQVAQTANGAAAAGPTPAGAEPLPPAPTNSAAGLQGPQAPPNAPAQAMPPGPAAAAASPAPGPVAQAASAAPPGLLARLGIIPSAQAAEAPPAAPGGPMVPGNAIAAAAGQNGPQALPRPNIPPPSLVQTPPPGPPVPPVAQAPGAAPPAAAPAQGRPVAAAPAVPAPPLSSGTLSANQIAHLQQLELLGKVAGIDISDIINNSPSYKAAVADAEARIKLRYAEPTAAAEARGKLSATPERVSPGAGVSIGGQPPAWYAPSAPIKAFNPQTQRLEWATSTPQASGGSTIQFSGVPAEPSEAEKAAGAAAGRQIPITPTTAPIINQPIPTPRGTMIPPTSMAAPISGTETELNDRSKDFADTVDKWGNSTSANYQAEQRMEAMASVLRTFQSGVGATQMAEAKASLNKVGLHFLDGFAGNLAQAQELLKNNLGVAISTLDQSGLSRQTQGELMAVKENFANPNVQPEANQAILSQALGYLRWERAMQQDWADAKKAGWRDPQDYQRAWAQMPTNSLTSFVERSRQQLGPFAGQQPAPGAPAPPGSAAPTYKFNPQTKRLEPFVPQ